MVTADTPNCSLSSATVMAPRVETREAIR